MPVQNIRPIALAVGIALVGILSGCIVGKTIGSATQYVGQPETALFAKAGAPNRQLTAPSGAKVDVWEERSFNGQNVLCTYSFFVKDGIVVGASERGFASNCGGQAGVTQ